MPKRDRLAVIYDILSIIRDKKNAIKPTPLLRFSNLSTQRFNEYMGEMIKKEFVKKLKDKKGREYYTLADKGFHYLEKYQVIRGFINDFDL